MESTTDRNPDDASILGHRTLWRRIPPYGMTDDDSVTSGRRPSTSNFADPEMSVVIEDECEGGLETLLKHHEAFGVAAFTVAEVRALGWGVIREYDEALPGHAIVTGPKTKSKRSKIAKQCRLVVVPT